MKKYKWERSSLDVHVQGVAGDPIKAFKLLVLPGISKEGWIEDSSKIFDTNMSMREWMGLIIHALALKDLTGEDIKVAQIDGNDDGALVLNSTECIWVEQTLATYRNPKQNSLNEEVRNRINKKSNISPNYAENRHLVIFCNMEGDLNEEELARDVASGDFSTVNIFGFNSEFRTYLSLIFDKNDTSGPIGKMAISEEKLIIIANKIV